MSFFDIQKLYDKIVRSTETRKLRKARTVAPAIKNFFTIDETRALERKLNQKIHVRNNRLFLKDTGERLGDSFSSELALCQEAQKTLKPMSHTKCEEV